MGEEHAYGKPTMGAVFFFSRPLEFLNGPFKGKTMGRKAVWPPGRGGGLTLLPIHSSYLQEYQLYAEQ